MFSNTIRREIIETVALQEHLELMPESRRDEKRPIRVLQFGRGNFLRAFVDWMIDLLNEQTDFQGDIAIAQPRTRTRDEKLAAADCVYTVVLRGNASGQTVDRRRLITSVRELFSCHESPHRLIELARSPELRFVVSNTTEAGIVYRQQEYKPEGAQETFPANVAAMLRRRYDALGTAEKTGLIFLPTELIESNGDSLRQCVLQHMEDWRFGGALRRWVESECVFCNTLVDRIVAGYPDKEIETLEHELGYRDPNLVEGEIFHLWVIEGPEWVRHELPLDRIGLNVIWTDNLRPYRTQKVRLLNGGHTATVLAAYLAGLSTVGEMMSDDLLARFIHRVLFDEVVPTIELPEEKKRAFAQNVGDRFANLYLRHRLLDISLNSVSKWRVRVLPTLLDYQKITGRLPAALTFSLAALIRFYDQHDGIGARSDIRTEASNRADDTYPVRDETAVLTFMESCWQEYRAGMSLDAMVARICAEADLWGMDLTQVDAVVESVAHDLTLILNHGIREAVRQITNRIV